MDSQWTDQAIEEAQHHLVDADLPHFLGKETRGLTRRLLHSLDRSGDLALDGYLLQHGVFFCRVCKRWLPRTRALPGSTRICVDDDPRGAIGAAYCDGAGSLASYKRDDLAGAGNLWISVWVRLRELPDGVLPLVRLQDAAGNLFWQLAYDNTDGQQRFRFYVSDGNDVVTVSSVAGSNPDPLLRRWVHLLAWYDATADTIHLRVNDEEAQSEDFPNDPAAGSVHLRIGGTADLKAAFDQLYIGRPTGDLAERIARLHRRLWRGGKGTHYLNLHDYEKEVWGLKAAISLDQLGDADWVDVHHGSLLIPADAASIYPYEGWVRRVWEETDAEPGAASAPELFSATVLGGGTTLQLVFDEPVVGLAPADFEIAGHVLSNAAGEGQIWTFTVDSVDEAEDLTLDYTGDAVENAFGVALDAVASFPVTNNAGDEPVEPN